MPVLPSDIPTGIVTANWWFADEDSIDTNTDIDVTPVVSGSVYFKASTPYIRMPSKPITVIPLVFEGVFDANGNLTAKGDPTIGMRLPATDSDLMNPTNYTWHATFNIKDANGNPVNIPEFDFSVPTGGTVDLTNAIPVSSSPGTITIQGPKGDVGPSTTITIGSVTTGAAGSSAAASMTGTAPNQTLNLTIPTGATGATGAQGPAGAPGNQSQTIDTIGALEVKRTNLAPNPSFESTSGTVVVRTNLATNPGMEGASGTVNVRVNEAMNPSFETATTSATIRTNLCTNPSLESGATTGWAGKGATVATIAVSTAQAWQGTQSLLVTMQGTAGGAGITISSLTVGTIYTLSGYVYIPATGGVPGVIATTASIGYGTSTTVTGAWTRLSYTFTATATSHQIGFDANGTGIASGQIFYIDGVMLEVTDTVLPYFDGATAAGNDYTYAWLGTALLSSSTQSATQVSLVTTTNGHAKAFQSTQWSSNRTKALRIVPTDSSNDSFVDATSSIYPATSLVANAVYTVAGTVRLSAALTGTLNANALKFRISVGGTELTFTYKATATNAAGVYRVVGTFTNGASSTIDWFRLYNGASGGNGDVWWDELLFEAGDTDGSYFDGVTKPAVRTNLALNPSVETNTSNTVSAGGGTTTWTRDLTQFYVGTASLKVVTDGTAVNQGIQFFTANGLGPGQYIGSAYVKGTAGQQVYAQMRTSSPFVDTVSANFTLTGGWDRISAPVNTATTVSNPISFMIRVVGTQAITFYVDAVLIEAGNTLGTYFDGSTAATATQTFGWSGTANGSTSLQYNSDYTPAWTGTADASRVLLTAPAMTLWGARWYGGNGGTGVMFQTNDGMSGKALRKLWKTGTTAAANDAGINLITKTTVTPNTVYTLSVYTRPSITTANTCYVVWYDSGGATISNTSTTGTATPANVWTRTFATVTAPANAATADFIFGPYVGSVSPMPAGATIDFDNALIEAYGALGTYFDGSTAASGDYTYAWTGTANASSSQQKAPALTGGNTSGQSVSYQSTDWNNSRGHSLRITPTSATDPNSYAAIGGDGGAFRLGMTAGQTYTVSATCRLTGAQTGTLSGSARAIMFFYKNSGGTYVSTTSTQAPNVAGSTRVSVTVTIPAGSTEAMVRLVNGALVGGGDVWWDDILVENTSYLNPYFDGSMPSSYWSGTADQSTSVSAALGQGMPDNTKILRGDLLWAASPVEAPMAAGDDFNNYTTSGVYRMEVTPTGLNYPIAASGILEVWNRTPAGGYTLQEFTPVWATTTWNGRSFYQRFQLNGTWSAWQFFGSYRVDQTAGRAVYKWDPVNNREQLIYGDTGLRNVSGDTNWVNAFVNTGVAVSGGVLYIRRIDYRVDTLIQFTKTVGGSVTATSAIPAGYQPSTIYTNTGTNSAIEIQRYYHPGGGSSGIIQGNLPTGGAFSMQLSWVTNDAWPTTLPGTAIGVIPNA